MGINSYGARGRFTTVSTDVAKGVTSNNNDAVNQQRITSTHEEETVSAVFNACILIFKAISPRVDCTKISAPSFYDSETTVHLMDPACPDRNWAGDTAGALTAVCEYLRRTGGRGTKKVSVANLRQSMKVVALMLGMTTKGTEDQIGGLHGVPFNGKFDDELVARFVTTGEDGRRTIASAKYVDGNQLKIVNKIYHAVNGKKGAVRNILESGSFAFLNDDGQLTVAGYDEIIRELKQEDNEASDSDGNESGSESGGTESGGTESGGTESNKVDLVKVAFADLASVVVARSQEILQDPSHADFATLCNLVKSMQVIGQTLNGEVKIALAS